VCRNVEFIFAQPFGIIESMHTRHPTNPKSVVFLKPERTKAVVLDGVLLVLKNCVKCSAEFWGNETQVKCEPCGRAVRKSPAKRKRKTA
jgi:ribosomal protein S27E